MKKIIGIVLVIGALLIGGIVIDSPDTKIITDKQLEKSAQKFVNSKINKDIYNFTIDVDSKSKIIKIFDEELEYNVKYDILSEQPKLVFEIPAKGVSYDEFDKLYRNWAIPMLLGYTVISNTQGISIKDAKVNFMSSYLKSLSNLPKTDGYIQPKPYTVDYLSEGGIDNGNSSSFLKTIYISQWPKKYKEYLNDIIYPNDFISTDESNSYLWTIKNLS